MKIFFRGVMNVLLVLSLVFNTNVAQAISLKPKITWDCNLIRMKDDSETFVYFDPRLRVKWYGSKLKFHVYYWFTRDLRKAQADQTYGDVRSRGSGKNLSRLDISHKFGQYGGVDSKFKKVTLVVVDNFGRSSSASCIWKKGAARG